MDTAATIADSLDSTVETPRLTVPLAPVNHARRPVSTLLSQPKPGTEALSPFVSWAAEDREALPDELVTPAGRTSLLVDLLRDPRAVAERLLDPARVPSLVLGSLGLIVVSTAFFVVITMIARGSHAFALQAIQGALNVLIAVAAALGPIYATSVLVSARMPMARLVATLLAASATGSLVLAGLAPVVYVLWKIDPFWAGNLSLVSAFGVAGLAGGARIHALLLTTAEAVTRSALGDPDASLAPYDAFRVGILARMALVILGFTTALAIWGFGAFA
ncbi:MAG: hypothetical protein QM765_08435 [Myxococcales bacterium]